MCVCGQHLAFLGSGLGLSLAQIVHQVLLYGRRGASLSAAEETFLVNQEGKTRNHYGLLLTWPDAFQNLCFPGICAPRCFSLLQLGDQNRFGEWKR